MACSRAAWSSWQPYYCCYQHTSQWGVQRYVCWKWKMLLDHSDYTRAELLAACNVTFQPHRWMALFSQSTLQSSTVMNTHRKTHTLKGLTFACCSSVAGLVAVALLRGLRFPSSDVNNATATSTSKRNSKTVWSDSEGLYAQQHSKKVKTYGQNISLWGKTYKYW